MAGLCQKHKLQHSDHVMVSPRGQQTQGDICFLRFGFYSQFLPSGFDIYNDVYVYRPSPLSNLTSQTVSQSI